VMRLASAVLIGSLLTGCCCVARPDGPGLTHLQPLPDDAAYWRDAALSNGQIGICGLVWSRPDWHLVVRVHWPRPSILIPVSDEAVWYTIPARQLVITDPDGQPMSIAVIQELLSLAAQRERTLPPPSVHDDLLHVPCWVRVGTAGIEMRVLQHPEGTHATGGPLRWTWVEAASR